MSYSAPSVESVPSIETPSVENSASSFSMPDANQAIELPNGTPVSGAVPSLAVPAATADAGFDFGSVNVPDPTEKIG